MRNHWERLLEELDYKEGDKILDVGGAYDPVPIADVVVDIVNLGRGGKSYCLLDLTGETLPFSDKSFDIVICCQTLEDLASPALIMNEMSRVGKRGIIEVPHRGPESVKRNLTKDGSVFVFGTGHHKWLIDEYEDSLRFTYKRWDMLMRHPIPKWTGTRGVHLKWKDKIDFTMCYDIEEGPMNANYARFIEENEELI